MGAVLTHQTSLLGCVDPVPKVVAPVGPVVEQAQCDLGGPRLVGRAAHSNTYDKRRNQAEGWSIQIVNALFNHVSTSKALVATDRRDVGWLR